MATENGATPPASGEVGSRSAGPQISTDESSALLGHPRYTFGPHSWWWCRQRSGYFSGPLRCPQCCDCWDQRCEHPEFAERTVAAA